MSFEYWFSHSLDDVLGRLQDAAFLEGRSAALGDERCSCNVQGAGDEVVVTTDRLVALKLPKVALKFFQPKQSMRMVETWRREGDGWAGSYHVDIEGQPLVIDATFSLVTVPTGCVLRMEHTPFVDIPLVRKPAEKFILGTIVDGTRQECDYLRDQLDGA